MLNENAERKIHEYVDEATHQFKKLKEYLKDQ